MPHAPLLGQKRTEMETYTNIIAACRRQDKKAQLQLYNLFCKCVYNSSLRILGNSQEAEEVMQETFLKVLTRPHLLQDNEKAMERMLRRIAINHSIDIFRKRNKHFKEFTTYSANTLSDNEEEESDEEEMQEATVEMIRQGIRKLPDGYRMILSLHLIEGLKYEEIAHQLEISASSVRSQYVRARKRLIQLIHDKNE